MRSFPITPTHTFDITGRRICLGDTVKHDYPGNSETFIVIFEDNAFRKQFRFWDEGMKPKPILECGKKAIRARLKVVVGRKEVLRTKVENNK